MNTKKLDEIMERIDNATNAANAEVESLQTQIEMANQSVAAANDAMTAAADAQDIQGYQAAKATRQDAQDTLDMYTARLEKLTVQPTMKEPEYKQIEQDAQAAAAVAVKDAEKQLADLTDKCLKIRDDLHAVALEVDQITHTAFNMTYPNKDCKTSTGAVPVWHEYKGAGNAIAWASRAAASNTYKKIKRQEDI